MTTVEEKAAAFDHLCRILKSRACLVSTKMVPLRSTASERQVGGPATIFNTIKYKEVAVYKWNLYSDGEDDFATACLKGIVK